MTPEQLQAIRERVNKVTEGDWEVTQLSEQEVYVTIGYTYANGVHSAVWIAQMDDDDDSTTYEERMNNAEFIAHAREDVPALLDEIERLQNDTSLADKVVQLSQIVLKQDEEIQRLKGKRNGICADYIGEYKQEIEWLRNILDRFVTAFAVGDAGHLTLNGRSWSALEDARQALEGSQ